MMSGTTPIMATHPLRSPALSAASGSSYDLLSMSMSSSFRVDPEDSDDEIVWSVSEGALSPSTTSENGDATSDDDDFILLSRPHSPAAPGTGISTPGAEDHERAHSEIRLAQTPVTASASNVKSLDAQMKALSLSEAAKAAKQAAKERRKARKAKKARKKARKAQKALEAAQNGGVPVLTKKEKKAKKLAAAQAANAYPSPAPSPKVAKKKVGGTSPQPAKHSGLGERPIVDDVSDRLSVVSGDNESIVGPTLYEEAATFISSFLSNPDAKNDSVCRLTLLQSLIIELGLATSSLTLPSSLKAAKVFLKSRVFLNIKEYVAVRSQGPEAVQKVLYPSRKALIKDIKKKRNAMPLQWVKQHGLQVLLVGWMN